MKKFIERTEKSMQETETSARRRFYIALIETIVVFPIMVWIVLFGIFPIWQKAILFTLMLMVVICLFGLNSCYRKIKKHRRDFRQQMQKLDDEYQKFLNELEDEKKAYLAQCGLSSKNVK